MKLEEYLKRIKYSYECDIRWHEDDGYGTGRYIKEKGV